ncbi:hypothetical protein PQX77_021061 [Marasmius sp. AFHP31]|nr:hypothetical protein PQX77_021061 [Marasmius sp. AFHP31]
MSATRTETKIETKTETQKGKGRVAPGGDEPSRPGTPPGDPDRSDGDLADINEFNKAFNELAGDSEHNNAGLRLFYKQGINPALKATIDTFEVIPMTLEGWQKAAVRKYNDWVRSKAKEKAWGRRKLTTTNSTTTTTTIRAANTSNSQQTRNTTSTPGGRLTPEEYATYMKEGQCFDCGQKSHMRNSPDCSKEKASTSAAFTSGNWRQTTAQNARATTASSPTASPTSDSPALTTPTTTDDAISVAARALAALTPEQHAALASVFSKKDF